MEHVEILIAGGGLAGLAAAARLGTTGRSVTVVDPAPAEADATGQHDQRTTAFLQPAIQTLRDAGAWEGMADGAAPLNVMRIVDAGGRERTPRETADFSGAETSQGFFGFNVSNTAARRALIARIDELSNVTLRQGTTVTGFLPRTNGAVVRMSDGTQVTAKLVIAADGRDSTLRQLAGIGAKRWSYDQKAVVFCVLMMRPHDGISTEIHRTGGPLTLVPMADRDGQPTASIVWLSRASRAEALMAMDEAHLSTELTAETMGLFGPLEVTGPRATWPMISQVAHRLRAERLAVIAEAAHVMPPIGAQGLNTSLSDIETLAGLSATASDPGDERVLARYEARQMPMILAKVAGIDALNRMVMTEHQPLRDLRALGLGLVNRLPPLRRLAIKAGMGG